MRPCRKTLRSGRNLICRCPPFRAWSLTFRGGVPEPNFARLHAATLEHHPNLTVWLHANAVELQLEDGAAEGIRCRTLDGAEAIFCAAEYVFCLGTIESSRFFLQPRSGPLPWNDSGLLGRHFQDHLDANAAEVVPKDGEQFHALFDNVFLNGHKYHPKLRLAPAEQRRLGTLTVASTMVFSSRSEIALASGKATFKHLLRGRLQDLTAKELATALVHLPLLVRQGLRYGLAHRAYNPPGSRIQLRVHCEQEPLGASCITLSDQRDLARPAAHPPGLAHCGRRACQHTRHVGGRAGCSSRRRDHNPGRRSSAESACLRGPLR